MPYYILESSEETLTIGGVTLTGVPTTGHSRALWLYVVNTEENPMDWPESPTGRGPGHRRAPAGVGNWWVVVRVCFIFIPGKNRRGGDARCPSCAVFHKKGGMNSKTYPTDTTG